MILEIDRIVSTWLNGATYGANAMLATIPLDTGDTAPEDFALITDETQNGDVARDELPAESPSLSVSIDVAENVDGEVQVVTAEGDVKLRLRVGLTNAATAEGRRDLSYRLRAIARSFRELMRADESNRTRNGVYLEYCSTLTFAIVNAKDQQGSSIVTGYVLPTVHVRDTKPYHDSP
jgi:hypothetical protein